MKIVKKLNINDGKATTLANDNYLFIEDYPRTAKIIGAFLSKGWTLMYVTTTYNPAIQQEGGYSFYRGGQGYIFMKECKSNEDDDSDIILREVLNDLFNNEQDSNLYQNGDYDYDEDYNGDEYYELE